MLENIAVSVASAIAGFALAIASGVVRLGWQCWQKPRLEITVPKSGELLRHFKGFPLEEFGERVIYGFCVRNAGRSIAAGVKCQLLKIEMQERGKADFTLVSEETFDLGPVANQTEPPEYKEVTLVPGAVVEIKLGFSIDESYDVIYPAVKGRPYHYEEITGNCKRYRFRVVAFAEGVKHVVKDIVIDN